MTKFRVSIGVMALSMASVATPAPAQIAGAVPSQNLEGLTVVGKGNSGARPNRLEIDLEVSAASEISSDVIVKYRDAKKRLQEAFAALKLANVAVEERALGVDQKGQAFNPYYMDGAPVRKGKVEVQLKRKLVVTCSGIREMDEEALLQLVAKLLDVAQDAGAKLGGQNDFNPYYGRYNMGGGLVRFVLDDYDALQEKAYEVAIADARKRAGRLAKLSGVELGPVAGVREVLVPGEKPQASGVMIYEMAMQSDEEMPRKRLESSKFHEIPVRVELQVRFDLAGPSRAESGRAADERHSPGSGSPRRGRRAFLRRCGLGLAGVGLFGLVPGRRAWGEEKEVLPKHLTPETLRAVLKGLDHLASSQADDGSWIAGGGQAYPVAMAGLAGTAFLAHGNSPTRGKYAKTVQGVVEYLVRCTTESGLITGPGQDSGMPMHGHGFALMFLASVYGMVTKASLRRQVGDAVRKAVTLTSQGQSGAGGWTYTPGTGDEGSVTVTQVQALRQAQNAGFLVPRAVIESAAGYLEKCRTPEGGIQYSLSSGRSPRLPISAAAVATLYNAGQFDSPIATDSLKFVWDHFRAHEGWSKGGGHDFYTHLYASQGFYMAGDTYWDAYFPKTRDQLISMQGGDGSWNGDGIGQVYGTAIAVIILQLPYKYLPVFQR